MKDDPSEPARISIKARDAKELAWILFHEGFRAGYEARERTGFGPPPNMEFYIREIYALVVGEIREQNPDAARNV
jgi:hypothetical protein